MSQRSALLDLERKKLSFLRNKLAEQELRVKTLEQMEDDPFDAVLERELEALDAQDAAHRVAEAVREGREAVQASAQAPILLPAEEAAQPGFVWGAKLRNPRRVPPQWVKLLRYIGREGKFYDQVVDFIGKSGISITAGAARTQLMNYRKDYGFVENPKKGFYVATEKALSFIQAQEGEDPAVGDGGVFSLQPTPMDRAAA
jgi:hypothetical protein